MLFGISGAPVPVSLRYAADIQKAADDEGFWPLFAYAVAFRESIGGELAGLWPSAATVISGDNGHGICQPTPAPWWTPRMNAAWAAIDWQNPCENMRFGIKWFLSPAVDFWNGQEGFIGTSLIRLVAAEYNAGRPATMKAHEEGDVDRATTNGYAAAVLGIYENLVTRGVPA